MSDYIIRGMAADKQVRFFAANTKDLVEKQDGFTIQALSQRLHLED